jgi:hypothetical protein
LVFVNNILVIKPSKMRQVRHVTYMGEKRTGYIILVWKSEGMRLRERFGLK